MQANEDELNSRHSHLPTVLQVGHGLIKADNFGSEKIQNRIDNIEDQWKNLLDLANFRRRRLMEAVDFYQVSAGFLLEIHLPLCLNLSLSSGLRRSQNGTAMSPTISD